MSIFISVFAHCNHLALNILCRRISAIPTKCSQISFLNVVTWQNTIVSKPPVCTHIAIFRCQPNCNSIHRFHYTSTVRMQRRFGIWLIVYGVYLSMLTLALFAGFEIPCCLPMLFRNSVPDCAKQKRQGEYDDRDKQDVCPASAGSRWQWRCRNHTGAS